MQQLIDTFNHTIADDDDIAPTMADLLRAVVADSADPASMLAECKAAVAEVAID